MSWYDFKNNQFRYGDEVYLLASKELEAKDVRTRMLFLLNMRREVFVTLEDIVEFVWSETDMDYWPDAPFHLIRNAVVILRATLPPELKIVNAYTFGYKLTEDVS